MKIFKKSLSFLMSFVVLLSIVSGLSFSAYAESYKCGENLTYSVDLKSKTLYISGYGDMYDWGTADNPYPPYWTQRVNFDSVVIAEGVTSIGTYAFYQCDNIYDIIIPNSIKKIGDNSFYHCYNMRIDSLPTNLKEIGSGAFLHCYNINQNLIIPNGVTYIGDSAFSGCKYLRNVTISNSMKNISSNLFSACSDLKSIIIPDSITDIGNSAFFDCSSLSEIILPNNLKSIGDSAFRRCYNLVDIEIPQGVTNIGEYAFYSCNNLISITIPDSVMNIGNNAFSNCIKLEKAILPKCNVSVDEFNGCSSLSSVILPEGVNTIGNRAFTGCSNLEYISIPDSVISIGIDAFEDCTNLTTFKVGKNLKEFPYWAFYRCINLSNIQIDENNKYLYSNGSIVFSKDKTSLIYYSEANKEKEYLIPEHVIKIGEGAFNFVENLRSVIVPDNVKELDSSSFSGCSNLESFTLSDKAYIVGTNGYLLSGTNVKDIYYTSTIENFNKISDIFASEILSSATIHCTDGLINNTDEVHNSFSSADKTFSDEFGYYYKDSYFAESANKYNQSLATMSLCLSLSTYNASDNYENADENVRTILNQCGFQDYEQTMYHIKPESGTIAFSIANKELDTGETLIVVAVRSGGYEAEWASNVTVGKTGNHEGFQNAADCVYRVLNNYITDSEHNLSDKKVKFWITGYSRGAAVSNILAAKLFQEKYKEVTYSSINDVYAYCFATPAGVSLTEDPHNDCYNNIFNIIEYNDPVPLVAPCQWDFDRYGITKVLPCAESTKDAFNYINPMIEQLNAMGYEYKVSDFRSAEIGNPFVPNNDTLGTFLRKRLCDDGPGALVPFVLGSRTNYVNMYQQDAINAMPVENITNLLFDFYFQLPYFITWSTLHGTTVKTLVDNMDLLAYVHENQAVYLAWMQSMDNNYVNNAKTYFSNGDYRAAKINCPVDVYVYDSDNNLVASIINETPQKIENSSIISSIDENNQKIIYLPCDEEYNLKIIAREDCETTYTVNEYTGVDSQVSRIVSYSEINMEKDDLYEASVGRYSDDEIANGAINGTDLHYTFEGTNGVMNADLDVSGDEVENYTYNVELKCDDEKGSVLGGGTYRKGDFCQIVATNSIGYIFDGWYIGNVKISSESIYRFAVDENEIIEAKFITCQHSHFLSEEIEATCTEEGYTKFTCSDCGYSYQNDYIPSLGHRYNNGEVTKKPTCTSSGVLTYTCTACKAEYTETIPETGHQFREWVVVKEATETEEGIREHVCNVCGEKETQIIPILTTENNNEDNTVKLKDSNTSDNTQDNSKTSPNTGSESIYIIFIAIGSAVIAIAVLAPIKKKRV